MEHLEVNLAGALTLRRGRRELGDVAFPGRQLRLVTAMLVLGRADLVAVEVLADELWRGTPPARWRVGIRGLVSKVRRAVGDLGLPSSAVVAVAGAYKVELGVVRVDLEVAAARVEQARVHLDAGRVEQALHDANRARAVLSRPVVPGVRSDWLDGVRDHVAGQHLDALIAVGEGRRRLGRAGQARMVLSRAVEAAPFREDAWRELMRTEASAGNTGGAMRAYERCRRHLVDELGVDPSGATQRLHGQLLEDVPVPAVGVSETDRSRVPSESSGSRSITGAPYVGLRAFQRHDAGLFFGRDAEVQEVVTRLVRCGIVAVVGPSGIGKSSLVRAGLLPALDRGAIPDSDTWVSMIVTPGDSPLDALAGRLARLAPRHSREDLATRLRDDPDQLHALVEEVLADQPPGARVLLVVDQLEELFTIGDHDQVEGFVGQLTAATRRLDGRVVVVVTLRADFYDRATGVPGLADLLSRSQFVVPPLQGEQVEEAVQRPAERVGAELEKGLLARIIADVAGQPGTLPLLQHLLLELWEQRTGSVMTRGAYADLGGVTGALAKRADDVYATLGPDDRARARRVLLRGVRPSEDGADARRPIPESEWTLGDDGPDVQSVVDHLVEARLLTATRDPASGERMVELAHEALIAGWPRLRDWVDQARGWLLDLRRLSSSAADWERHGRDEHWLLTGRRLDEAEDAVHAATRNELDLHLSPPIHALVEASRREHLTSQRVASIQALVDDSRTALDDDPQRALLLALVAAERQEGVPEMSPRPVDQVLHRAVVAQREQRRFTDVGELLAVSPEASTFVTARDGGGDETTAAFHVRDGRTGDRLLTLPAARHGSVSAVFNPAATVLITGVRESQLRVWRTSDGAELARLQGPEGSALTVWDCDPTGQFVVAGDRATPVGTGTPVQGQQLGRGNPRPAGSTSVTCVWNLDTGEIVSTIDPPRWLEPNDWGPSHASFDPDGKLLAICIWARRSTAQIIDVATGACVFELPPEISTMTTAAWSPDGRWLALGGDRITVIDVPGERVQTSWAATDGLVAGLAWADDSRALFVGGRSVQRWNAPVGRHEFTYRASGPFGPNTRVFASRDGQLLFSGSRTDGTVRVWDATADAGAEVARVATDDHPSMAWSADGERLAVSRPAGVAVVDATTWQDVATLTTELDEDRVVAWSPDGTRLAAGHQGGVVVWNPASCREVFRIEPDVGGAEFSSVCFTPAGRHLVVAEFLPPGDDDTWAAGYRLRIVDRDGIESRRLERPGDGDVMRMETTPDGSTLAVSRYGGLVPLVPVDCGIDLWNLETGTRRTLDTIGLGVAVDPGAERLATGGLAGHVEIWNVRSGVMETRLHGHTGIVWTVAWSRDGQLIATGGADATVRVWDAATGGEALRLELEAQHEVTEVAFSPDGSRLIGGQQGHGIWVWTLDRRELTRIAQDRVTRRLTAEERRNHVDDQHWPD